VEKHGLLKNIGEIDHLIIDKLSGRVAYAVMSFGGFMGLGHSHYPIPWGAPRVASFDHLVGAQGNARDRATGTAQPTDTLRFLGLSRTHSSIISSS
jgi:hypothetical protein